MIAFTLACALILVISINLANSDYVWLRVEHISGNGRCRYLTRVHLAKLGGWSMYLHWFTGDDWSLDKHDHPRPFWSIGLWGRYVENTERTLDGGHIVEQYEVFTAPWVRSFPPYHTHRLLLLPFDHDAPKRPCLTLVIVGPVVREWGWWVQKNLWPLLDNEVRDVRMGTMGRVMAWVQSERYYSNDQVADARKSCP
ncbi:MAG TPA: hypothetical protein VD932_03800 [Aquabacterium sp.]|nr:hypothetical protein [Aquabacterium sp.]